MVAPDVSAAVASVLAATNLADDSNTVRSVRKAVEEKLGRELDDAEKKFFREEAQKKAEGDEVSEKDSDEDDDDEPPKKKEKKSQSSSSGGSADIQKRGYLDLGQKKRATVSKFKGKVRIDLREFYEADGEMKPGRKGINMSVEQFNVLRDNIGALDDWVQSEL